MSRRRRWRIRGGRPPWVSTPALWQTIIPGGVLLGLSSGLVFPAYISYALQSVPADRHAVGSAVNFMSQRIGMTFGIAVAITFIAASQGSGALHRAFPLTIAGCLVCFGLGLLVPAAPERA